MHALFHLCRGILHGVPIPLLLTLLCSLATVTAATFTVTTEADSGAGTLRQAITEANATGGADTIEFNIPGGGVRTIALTSQLPNITDPVTINGYTQPGASQNTQAAGNDAVLTVRLDGTNAGGGAGLHITVGSSTVRGLVITNWSTGIQLSTLGGNTIAGNFLGTDATGNTAAPNTRGIFMFASNSNQIGGTTPAARNLISGNEIGIDTFTSSNNIIEGNFIGTNKAGTAALPVANSNARGINLAAVCDNNSVGGTAAGARNIISGLTGTPVSMQGTVGNRVEGNYIGTDVSGDVAIGNGFGNNASCAVCIVGNRNPLGSGGGPASDNRVGGTAAGAGNVIAAFTAIQGGAAIFVGGSSVGDSRRANSNIIQGNFIGTNKNGTIAFANPSSHGVHIQDGDDNIVGGTTASAANIIANNARRIRAPAASACRSPPGFEIRFSATASTITTGLELISSQAAMTSRLTIPATPTPDRTICRISRSSRVSRSAAEIRISPARSTAPRA